MPPKNIGPIAQAWYRWKALRLPWRKRFLVGYDLEGNTYWEFCLVRGSNERWRRIVDYPRSTHYSQVKVSPQWHQWLRYTRHDPPSIDEQEQDVVRREKIKLLAAQANARWEAKPKVMESPEDTARRLAPVEDVVPQQPKGRRAAAAAAAAPRPTPDQDEVENPEDPWAKAKAQGPSESWQPGAWDPTAVKKR